MLPLGLWETVLGYFSIDKLPILKQKWWTKHRVGHLVSRQNVLHLGHLRAQSSPWAI
jgi:hypothetical protein